MKETHDNIIVGKESSRRFIEFFRDRQNDFVELEDFKLLGRLFHNLDPLTLNLLNLNDLSCACWEPRPLT